MVPNVLSYLFLAILAHSLPATTTQRTCRVVVHIIVDVREVGHEGGDLNEYVRLCFSLPAASLASRCGYTNHYTVTEKQCTNDKTITTNTRQPHVHLEIDKMRLCQARL